MTFVRSFARTAALLFASLSAACSPASSQAASSPATTGGMTLDQFLQRHTSRIMAADADGDGKISRAEMTAMVDAHAAKAGRDPSRRFDAMDLDHDGYLDKAEITAVLTKRFRRMDRNGDGVLTPDERMEAHPARARNAPMDAAAKSQP